MSRSGAIARPLIFGKRNNGELCAWRQPHVVSLFPSQVAYICRHPQLDQFDLSSVLSIVTGGSTTNPVYERQLYDKVPNLVQYSIVSRFNYWKPILVLILVSLGT